MPFDPARAKSLFLSASDIPDPDDRIAFLDRECGPDVELRARVEALLLADKTDGGNREIGSEVQPTGTFTPDEPRGRRTVEERVRVIEHATTNLKI